MKTVYYILLSLIVVPICYGQTNSISSKGFYIPENIEECNIELNKILGKKAKKKIKSANERDLRNVTGFFITGEWFEDDSTRLANYFNEFSMTSQDFQDRDFLILLSYHRFINNQPFDITFESKKITDKRDAIKREREEQYKINIIADSIDGVFIPTDLYSCFMELDRLLSDTIKQNIGSKNDTLELLGEYHMGLGRWMRNNWGLWGGSRLQIYFQDRKIFHPDDMSGIVIESYAKYLNGDSFDLNEIIQKINTQYEEFMKNHGLEVLYVPPESLYSKKYKRFLRMRKIDDIDGIY